MDVVVIIFDHRSFKENSKVRKEVVFKVVNLTLNFKVIFVFNVKKNQSMKRRVHCCNNVENK